MVGRKSRDWKEGCRIGEADTPVPYTVGGASASGAGGIPRDMEGESRAEKYIGVGGAKKVYKSKGDMARDNKLMRGELEECRQQQRGNKLVSAFDLADGEDPFEMLEGELGQMEFETRIDTEGRGTGSHLENDTTYVEDGPAAGGNMGYGEVDRLVGIEEDAIRRWPAYWGSQSDWLLEGEFEDERRFLDDARLGRWLCGERSANKGKEGSSIRDRQLRTEEAGPPQLGNRKARKPGRGRLIGEQESSITGPYTHICRKNRERKPRPDTRSGSISKE